MDDGADANGNDAAGAVAGCTGRSWASSKASMVTMHPFSSTGSKILISWTSRGRPAPGSRGPGADQRWPTMDAPLPLTTSPGIRSLGPPLWNCSQLREKIEGVWTWGMPGQVYGGSKCPAIAPAPVNPAPTSRNNPRALASHHSSPLQPLPAAVKRQTVLRASQPGEHRSHRL